MNRIVRALEARYQAQVEEALAVIELYLNKAVGVGDHDNVLESVDNAVENLDQATSKLQSLRALFAENQQSAEGPTEQNTQ